MDVEFKISKGSREMLERRPISQCLKVSEKVSLYSFLLITPKIENFHWSYKSLSKNSWNGNDTMTNGICHRLIFLYLNKSSFKKFVKWQLHSDKFYWSSLNLLHLYKSKKLWGKKVMTNFIGNPLKIRGMKWCSLFWFFTAN